MTSTPPGRRRVVAAGAGVGVGVGVGVDVVCIGFGLGWGWLNRAASAAWRVLTPPTAIAREARAGGESNAVGNRIALAPRKRLSRGLRGRVTAPVNAVRAMHSPARPRTRERAGVSGDTAPTADAVGGVFVQSGGWFCLGLHGFVWFGVVLFLSAAPTETLGKSGLEN